MPSRLLLSWRLWLVLLLVAAAIIGGRKLLKKPDEPKKVNPVKEAERHTKTRAKVLEFTSELREVLDWRATQPPATDAASRASLIQALVERFTKLPSKDLPDSLREPWVKAKAFWQKLAAAKGTLDEATQKEGQAAMLRFNEALAAHGFPDLTL
jgi:homoserine kinase